MENEEVTTVVEQPASGTEAQPSAPVVDPEIKAKEEQKANLDRAIAEANETLRQRREAAKKAKQGIVEEEILPQIDDNDPGSKAWSKRISDTVAPALSQLEKQKDEVRSFALRRFLSDKPALAKSPEKLKELMSTYDRIKTATEQTQEGVLLDLGKAYGATFSDELIEAARNRRIDSAKEDMIASDIAIDRGSTTETSTPPAKRQLSAEERKIVEQWEASGAPAVD